MQDITLWINFDNGLIMKNVSEILGAKETKEYTYKFNTVTDKDVTPDLTGYKKKLIIMNNN